MMTWKRYRRTPRDYSLSEEKSLGWLIAAYLVAGVFLAGYILALNKKIKATSKEIAAMREKLG